jgi:hypothetical protein
MGLQLYPIEQHLPGRRRMRLDIEADIFLKLLLGLDGKRRLQAHGLPKDARCIGLTVDSVWNTVSLMLESAEFDEVPPEYVVPSLSVTFSEWYGDASPATNTAIRSAGTTTEERL